MITVQGKAIGQRRPLFPEFTLEAPTTWAASGAPTLRDLIAQTVLSEVEAFRERQAERSLLGALTQAEISQGLMKGKVVSKGAEPQNVDSKEAVQHAIQAFEDGVYYVFVDEDQQTDLEAPVSLLPESRVTYLRLVALAGG